ncbi:MAG: endonuclease/exonuclease/phosphatase family protein [Anaerolineales bacterium]
MNKNIWGSITWGLLFLILIQMMGTLVESIYILDLLNTSLDEKVLGLLFFFTPVLLLFFRKRIPTWATWAAFAALFVARGITPNLSTSGRMLASGVCTGAGLILLVILLAWDYGEDQRASKGLTVAAGMALAVGFSVLLRALNSTIDYSLTSNGSWVGWGLGILLGLSLTQMPREKNARSHDVHSKNTSAVVGITLVLTLIYFAFSAPGVIARWTGRDYTLIVSAVSLLGLGYAFLANRYPGLLVRVSSKALLLWNLLFALSLTGLLLTQRVSFPDSSSAPAVVVGGSTWYQGALLVLTLLLYPVIFLDAQRFAGTVRVNGASLRSLVGGAMLGSLALVVLIFMNIFTNVWGYVEPVSPFFRNKFWLPFALIMGVLTILVARHRRRIELPERNWSAVTTWGWALLLGAVFLGTALSAIPVDRVRVDAELGDSLVVMTYNIQQANDQFGEKSYQGQFELIREVSPDVLALQESDSARISMNNNDYVRYFADELGYYSYYGPRTTTGTYGTAVLSKFPLLEMRSIFSYSDQDEIGTVEVEIELDGRRFTIYNVHPAGSDEAMRAFAETLLARSSQENVIALGDYNLREGDEAYQMIAAVYKNAWIDVYPTGVSDGGVDMSGRDRIDHIFVSPHLVVRNVVYLLPPESRTDHPAHWAEITWGE